LFGQVKEYFNKKGEMTTPDQADYYRLAFKNADGKLNGVAKEFTLNGTLRVEENYMDGKLLGSYQEWFDNGKLKEKGSWEKRANEKSYSGSIYVYHIDSFYDSTGTQLIQGGNGEYLTYFENGQLKDKVTFVKGYQQGQRLRYSSTGQISEMGEYQNGEIIWNGIYDSDGQLIYNQTEIMPEPKGGIQGLMQYLSDHVKYPRKSQKQGIEGTVYINFIINEQGKTTKVKVMKGISKECDDEGIRVITLQPAWTPGYHEGKPVPVLYTLPIRFQLD
jgi:TonB family protein